MVLLTMIARLADGLPLAASMQEDEQVDILALSPLSSLAVCLLIVTGICSKGSQVVHLLMVTCC